MRCKFRVFLWLALSILVLTNVNVYAHPDQPEHWAELEKMLFNDEKFRSSSQGDIKKSLEILEYAETLCIDQFGETNGTFLKGLNIWKVPGIPKSVSELNPSPEETQLSAKNHRNYTHQGWDYDYTNEKYGDLANWAIRKNLLLASTEKVFDFSEFSGKFLLFDLGYSEKCSSFSALIYYIHVLGDYIEDNNVDKFNGISNGHKIPFAANTAKPVDMFSEIEKHLRVVFADQSGSRVYSSLISDLETLASKARAISGSEGQVSEENFDQVKSYVTELMDILTGDNKASKGYTNAIYMLLKKEAFFADVFYPTLKN